MPAFAADIPDDAQRLIDEGGVTVEEVTSWDLADVWDKLWEMAKGNLTQPLHFAGQAILYLLVSCAIGLAVGDGGWRRCADAVSVLGFGALCLGGMMELVARVGDAAQESQAYLIAFVPVYSGVAALGGQTAGAAVYSTMFFTMSNFLAMAIRGLLLPVMQIYFCFSVSAAIWGNPGIVQAANLFSRCLSWLLKLCGALFSFVLGLQGILAGGTDSALLKIGRGFLSGAIPVVGDAAAAALSGAAGAVQLLKGSLALAATVVLGGAFLPVFLRCALYYLAFSGAGILSAGSGQSQCGQICRNFAEGVRLCGAILILYFFMVFLSTILLLVMGSGG